MAQGRGTGRGMGLRSLFLALLAALLIQEATGWLQHTAKRLVQRAAEMFLLPHQLVQAQKWVARLDNFDKRPLSQLMVAAKFAVCALITGFNGRRAGRPLASFTLRLVRYQVLQWTIRAVRAHLANVEHLALSRWRLLMHLGTVVLKLLVAVSVVAAFTLHAAEVQRHGASSIAQVTVFLFEVLFVGVSPFILMVRLHELGGALVTAVDVLTVEKYRPRMKRRLVKLEAALPSW